jgi:hypothetical protein
MALMYLDNIMAIISDGVTDIDLGKCAEAIDPILEKSSKRTGGGETRSVTGGERVGFIVQCRITPVLYRSLIDLMNNKANAYFFTPTDATEWTSLYPSTTWPLSVDLTALKRDWDRRDIFYVSFRVESSSYV